MRARIVKRDEKIVVLKTEKDKFLKVPKKNIDFDFKVGDWVTIEKNEDEIYILKFMEFLRRSCVGRLSCVWSNICASLQSEEKRYI